MLEKVHDSGLTLSTGIVAGYIGIGAITPEVVRPPPRNYASLSFDLASRGDTHGSHHVSVGLLLYSPAAV